jgi:hypothetical protein
VLETRESTFRQELYASVDADRRNDWGFAGLVGHIMTLRRAEKASKDLQSLETALKTLKHTNESITQEREAKK